MKNFTLAIASLMFMNYQVIATSGGSNVRAWTLIQSERAVVVERCAFYAKRKHSSNTFHFESSFLHPNRKDFRLRSQPSKNSSLQPLRQRNSSEKGLIPILNCLRAQRTKLFFPYNLQMNKCYFSFKCKNAEVDKINYKDKYEGIVTYDNDPSDILHRPIKPIEAEKWDGVKSTVQKLLYTRENILKGGAGLAAPQIGLLYPIFIYSPNRTTENLRVVVNPSFKPLSSLTVEGHEGCYSVPLRCAKIKRWEKIEIRYQDIDGHFIKKLVDGFESKVFQHEMDHLKGKLITDHEETEILSFSNTKDFQEFMKKTILEDSKQYK